MTGLLLALSLGVPPDELELAKAAAAAELAKLSLRESAAPVLPPAPRVTEYARVYARVLSGERVTVTVGSYGMDGAPFKIAAGVWLFYLDDSGVPTMRQEVSRAVAVPFRAGSLTTPGTPASGAGPASSGSSGFYRPGSTSTSAGYAGTSGRTEACPPAG